MINFSKIYDALLLFLEAAGFSPKASELGGPWHEPAAPGAGEALALPGAPSASIQIPLAQPNKHDLKLPTSGSLTAHKDIFLKKSLASPQKTKGRREPGAPVPEVSPGWSCWCHTNARLSAAFEASGLSQSHL